MEIPDLRLAFRAVEEGEIDRADLVRLLSVLENWRRGKLKISCAELLSREFRVDPAIVRRWEGELEGQPATRIGKYLLKRRIGRGGMGVVYEAEHPNLDRSVALKILTPGQRDPAAMQRFLREVKSAGRFNHPNIVHAYDAGIDGDIPFLVMELVAGENLFQHLLRRGPISTEVAIELLAQATSALWFLESLGWTHGDGKPSNWVISPTGALKLIDLGLCRPPGRPRRPEIIHGSPPYISPEALGTGDRIDIRSDLYSLGATFYHLLAGQPHYSARTVAELVKAMKSGPPARLRDVKPEVPAELAEIVERMMARKQSKRFDSCEDVASALEELPGCPRVAPPSGWQSSREPDPVPSQQRPRRTGWMLLAAAASCLAVGALLASMMLEPRNPDFLAPDVSDPDVSDPEVPAAGVAVSESKQSGSPDHVASPPTSADELLAQYQSLASAEVCSYPELFQLLDGSLHDPRVFAWHEQALAAHEHEAGPLWQALEEQVTRLRTERRFLAARRDLESFPLRLRLGSYRVSVDRLSGEIERQREEFLSTWIEQVRSRLIEADDIGAHRAYRRIFREPEEDRRTYLALLEEEYPGRPWLVRLEQATIEFRKARQERILTIQGLLASGRVPDPEWDTLPGGPDLEWAVEVIAQHPQLVTATGATVVERLFSTGLLASLDPGGLALVLDLLAIDWPQGSPDLATEHRAALLLAQADRASRRWELEPALQLWRSLDDPRLASTAALRDWSPRRTFDQRRLTQGVFLRSDAMVASVSGSWDEAPDLTYIFDRPRPLREWRHERSRWVGNGKGYSPIPDPEESALCECMVPFGGELRVKIEFTPRGKGWGWHLRYGDVHVGIIYLTLGEVAVVVGERDEVAKAVDAGVGEPWFEELLGNKPQTLVLDFRADRLHLEIAGRAHDIPFTRSPVLQDWFGMLVPNLMLLHRIELQGEPAPIWLEARAELQKSGR